MDKQSLTLPLQDYLDAENSVHGYVVSDVDEIKGGWETELFTFKAVYGGNEKNLVLRVFSGNHAGAKASKEYSLMKKLDEAGYPVPCVSHVEPSGNVIEKPFLIMERVMGKTLDESYRSDVDEAIKTGIYRLVELLVRLHKLDVTEFVGLPDLKTVSILDYINDYGEASDKLAPWLSPVIDWLKLNKPIESIAYQAVCHNDYHGFNVMLDQNDEAYVIDWGSARISDPRVDLGWTVLLYGTFGGAMFKAPLIELYRELGGNIDSFDFFEVLSVTRRIVDLVSVLYGGGGYGLKPDALDLMRREKSHFVKVHDLLTELTGIKLVELDTILEKL